MKLENMWTAEMGSDEVHLFAKWQFKIDKDNIRQWREVKRIEFMDGGTWETTATEPFKRDVSMHSTEDK